jgi:hypothetical protein
MTTTLAAGELRTFSGSGSLTHAREHLAGQTIVEHLLTTAREQTCAISVGQVALLGERRQELTEAPFTPIRQHCEDREHEGLVGRKRHKRRAR